MQCTSRSTPHRIWRFNKDRVTALRAYRLGTTIPSQIHCGATGSRPCVETLSTETVTTGSSSVDKLVFAGSTRLTDWACGSLSSPCNAKWRFATRAGCARTRSKSAASRMRLTRLQVTAAWPGVTPSPGACSDRKTLAAFGSAGVDNGASTAGLHASAKSMDACAANFRSLIGAFHTRGGAPLSAQSLRISSNRKSLGVGALGQLVRTRKSRALQQNLLPGSTSRGYLAVRSGLRLFDHHCG